MIWNGHYDADMRNVTLGQARDSFACNCVGPQNGEPKCPCMMRGVIERAGRWVEPERDLGPISAASRASRP